MGISPLAGFNELRARAADDAHELLILKVRAERLRRIHARQENEFGAWCGECYARPPAWPCETRRILDGLDGDDWGEGPP